MITITTQNSEYEVDVENQKFRASKPGAYLNFEVHNQSWIAYSNFTIVKDEDTKLMYLELWYVNPLTKLPRCLFSSEIKKIVGEVTPVIVKNPFDMAVIVTVR